MDDETVKPQFGRRKARLRLEEILAAKAEATQPAGEAISQLYQMLLTMPELKLSNGITAKVEPFIPPQEDGDGRMQCGIDLRLSNGNMLEFTLKNTGWGKPFTQQVTVEPDTNPRTRQR